MDFEIREGSYSDLPEISKVEKEVFGEAYTESRIEVRVPGKQKAHILLATLGKDLSGYSVGYEERGKYYLWMLGVLPKQRAKGIASKLIEECVKYAKQKGFSAIQVKTANRHKEMLRLLFKLGFNVTGFTTKEWGDTPAIWLELAL